MRNEEGCYGTCRYARTQATPTTQDESAGIGTACWSQPIIYFEDGKRRANKPERGDAQTARPYARLYNGLLSRDVRGRGYGDFDRRRSVGYGPGYVGRYL